MAQRTTIMWWAASFVAVAALVGLGVTASVMNAQADPTKPTPAQTASATTAEETAGVQPTDYLPPEKAAIAAQEAADAAHNAAVAADPAASASALAQKEAMAAEASALMAAATPQTVQDVCEQGPLSPAPPPGTHPDDFTTTSGWGQIVGNECIGVYVGSAGFNNPNDGAVFIMHTRDANAPGKAGVAPAWGIGGIARITVPGSGALTVQGVGPGGKFYLTSASGKDYTVLGMADQVKPGRG